jgi:hypothetical protein
MNTLLPFYIVWSQAPSYAAIAGPIECSFVQSRPWISRHISVLLAVVEFLVKTMDFRLATDYHGTEVDQKYRMSQDLG